MRLFVTVGNALQPFERLLRLVDAAVQASSEEVVGVCQIGCSRTEPGRLRIVRQIDREEFDRHLIAADLVVCHGGVGALAGAIARGHRPITLARRASLGEHVNSHQEQVVSQLVATQRAFDAVDGITPDLIWRARNARVLDCPTEPADLPVVAASLLPRVHSDSRWKMRALRILGACVPIATRLR